MRVEFTFGTSRPPRRRHDRAPIRVLILGDLRGPAAQARDRPLDRPLALPPPANAYAPILENCGSFFVNMQTLMDPESPYTPRGRQVREIMRSMD